MALNWIIAFLTGRSQVCKTSDGKFSDPQPITSSIVQGLGIGPTLWLIVESDLHPLSDANVIFKYADDTNLLVPENTDCALADEFSTIERWADTNGVLLILIKLKNWFYTVSHKKTRRLTLAHKFTKYWPISKILSLVDSVGTL